MRLTAGADDFQDGTTFSGQAAFVSVTLEGPGVEASDLRESDADDVSEVFVQETVGIPGSGGGAVDTQSLIDNPDASQARDRNDLLYAVSDSHGGQAWSGVYGVDNDTNEDGYDGYSSDPNLTLTGPGPNNGTPMFDTGYWGGGSPPPLTANDGNASPVETAADVAHQTELEFEQALKELRDS